MSPSPDNRHEQTEVEATGGGDISGNPLAGALNVNVSIPETIEISMVDASVLSDYEVWFFASSIIASAVIGFLVASLQGGGTAFIAMTIVLFIIFIIFLGTTLVKRRILRKKSKVIALRATQVVDIRNR